MVKLRNIFHRNFSRASLMAIKYVLSQAERSFNFFNRRSKPASRLKSSWWLFTRTIIILYHQLKFATIIVPTIHSRQMNNCGNQARKYYDIQLFFTNLKRDAKQSGVLFARTRGERWWTVENLRVMMSAAEQTILNVSLEVRLKTAWNTKRWSSDLTRTIRTKVSFKIHRGPSDQSGQRVR